MAVDYYVLFPCEVRKQVSDAEGKLAYSPDNYPKQNDGPSTAQFKTFLALTAFAGANGFEVLVDA